MGSISGREGARRFTAIGDNRGSIGDWRSDRKIAADICGIGF